MVRKCLETIKIGHIGDVKISRLTPIWVLHRSISTDSHNSFLSVLTGDWIAAHVAFDVIASAEKDLPRWLKQGTGQDHRSLQTGHVEMEHGLRGASKELSIYSRRYSHQRLRETANEQ